MYSLKYLGTQYSNVKYRHNVTQQISGIGSSCITEILYALNSNSSFPGHTQPLTSGQAHLAPGPGLLAQALGKLAAGQEGLAAGRLLHPGRPLLTGAGHGQPRQPVLAAALGDGGSVLAHCRTR